MVCDVRHELERAARDADAANSSTGTAAAMKSSDGDDMPSTFAKRLALDNADATGYSPSKPRGWTRALP